MDPQAFPAHVQNQMNGAPLEELKGMDLRDYFAASLLPALLTVVHASKTLTGREDPVALRKALCEDAYAWADSLVAARNS